MISKVAIIGTGLIGSSFGLALRRASPGLHVTGYDRANVLKTAEARGAINDCAATLHDAVKGSDVVLIATPINIAESLLAEMAPFLKPGAIVTDVCSVKRPMHEMAGRTLPETVRFIGGHPMTGSENAGPEHADELLFENATYVLCPDFEEIPDHFETEFADFLSLIRLTGARIMLLSAESHDRIAAAISHLPQLLAVGLVHYSAQASATDPQLLQLAAGGFRDMTRIASSPFAMWKQILASNTDEVLAALDGYISILEDMRACLADSDESGIESFFRSSEATRSSVPQQHKGFLRPLADVFVFINDEPGAIHKLTGILSGADINIKDIELLKIREGTGGTFRIGVDSNSDVNNALDILARNGFRAHRLK